MRRVEIMKIRGDFLDRLRGGQRAALQQGRGAQEPIGKVAVIQGRQQAAFIAELEVFAEHLEDLLNLCPRIMRAVRVFAQVGVKEDEGGLLGRYPVNNSRQLVDPTAHGERAPFPVEILEEEYRVAFDGARRLIECDPAQSGRKFVLLFTPQ